MKVQDTGEARSYALVAAFNALVRKLVDLDATYPHYDISGTTTGDYRAPVNTALAVAASSTATLADVIIMAEQCRTILLAHLGDANAHKAADTVNAALISTATIPLLTSASTQGQTDTLLTALSTAYEAHRVLTTKHSHADTTNIYTAGAAVDLASSKLAVADMKAQVNAHILLAWPTPSIELL